MSNARAVVPLASLADLAHDADFATWLEGQRNANTRRAYASDLRQFSAYLAQKHPSLTDIKALTLRECYGYPRWLREDMGYSVATVQRKLSAAKSICGYLTALGVWPTSPMATVRAYRVPEISPRVALTGEEARRLLDAARGDVRDYAILLTLGTLALRRSELANMRCNDISKRDGHVALHVIGKGGSDAYLPIPPHVAEAIRAYSVSVGREVEDVTQLRQYGDAAVFLPKLIRRGGEARCMNPETVRLIVQRWGRAAGIRSLDAHTMRHTAITMALDKGGTLRRVQAMARHSDPRTTTRYDSRASDLNESAVYLVRYDG